MSDTAARRELLRRARERLEGEGRRGLRRRPPRPRRPERETRAYRTALQSVVTAMADDIVRRVFPQIESLLVEAGTRQDAERFDAWEARLAALMAATRTTVEPAEEEAQRVAASLGDTVMEFATAEQIKQIRAVLGVEPDFFDAQRVGDLLNAWKARNSAFITRFTAEEIAAAQDTVAAGVRDGRSTRDIQTDLRERFAISDRRAEKIARTEISQLNTQISRERQGELGVDGYIWRTAADSRVRDEHAELDGRRVAWDDPPAETDGQHAGEPVNCRCTPEADVQSLLAELDDE